MPVHFCRYLLKYLFEMSMKSHWNHSDEYFPFHFNLVIVCLFILLALTNCANITIIEYKTV